MLQALQTTRLGFPEQDLPRPFLRACWGLRVRGGASKEWTVMLLMPDGQPIHEVYAASWGHLSCVEHHLQPDNADNAGERRGGSAPLFASGFRCVLICEIRLGRG